MDLKSRMIDDILDEMLKKIKDDDEVLAAFAYGSRVEGLSNVYSDLDIAEITKARESNDFLKIRDTEVEIEAVPLSRLNNWIFIAETGQYYDHRAILWCHRIRTSVSLYDKNGIIEQLRKKIDFKSITRRLTSYYSGQAAMSLNDSLGALESNDHETAIITARLGVESAAMAYLSSIGIINPKIKWIYRYLARERKSETDETAQEFLTLERACAKNTAEIKTYVEKACDFVNRLTTQAQCNP